MRTLVGALHREPAAALIFAAVGVLLAAVASGHGAKFVAPLVLVTAILAASYRSLLRWHSIVGLIVVVVLFVPIGRYQLPGSLPFNLELYRIVVALAVLLWISSLLIDPSVQLRRTAYDRPLLLIVACILASELVNQSRVEAYGSFTVKSLTFFLSFVLVYYLTATTIRSRGSVELILKVLAFGGGVVGAFAVLEQRSGVNVFDRLHTVLPLLKLQGSYREILRGGNLRVFGPAQHPIALGALLAVLVPIAIYLTRTSGRRWLVITALLVLGALASGSRTAISMFVAEAIMYLRLKPVETRRLWPLAVPAIVMVHFLLPGAIGGFKASFFPKGGIIAEQSNLGFNENAQLAGGRIRQIKPMLTEASHHFPFGEGFGTRIAGFNEPLRNAPILDDQWLNIVLDIGFVGGALWIWLIFGAVRRLMRASRSAEADGDDWLFGGLAASITAFAVGMLTFDAFGFTQVFFLFWILLGVSAALLAIAHQAQDSPTTIAFGKPRPD